MQAYLYAHTILLGEFDLSVIDESMGVVGGLFHPTAAYCSAYQATFRAHLQQANWDAMEAMHLRVYTETGQYLDSAGGIDVTDVEEFPQELSVAVCGIDWQVLHGPLEKLSQ